MTPKLGANAKVKAKAKAKSKGRLRTKPEPAPSEQSATKRPAETPSFFGIAHQKKQPKIAGKDSSNVQQTEAVVVDDPVKKGKQLEEVEVPHVMTRARSAATQAQAVNIRATEEKGGLRWDPPSKTVKAKRPEEKIVRNKAPEEKVVRNKAPEEKASEGKILEKVQKAVSTSEEKQKALQNRKSLDQFMAESGVNQTGRERLAALVAHWGPSRIEQIIDLWTFLGDGAIQPTSARVLQVHGPAGNGKSTLVRGYLDSMSPHGLHSARLNCRLLGSVTDFYKYLFHNLSNLLKSGPPNTFQASVDHSGRFPKSLDQVHLALMPLLQKVCTDVGPKRRILLVDHTEDLQRFDRYVVQQLVRLPEILQTEAICVVMVGQVPLEWIGADPAQEPPAIPFRAYTSSEARALLQAALNEVNQVGKDLLDNFLNLFMNLVYPRVSDNFRILLQICEELWQEFQGYATVAGDISLQNQLMNFQDRMQLAIHERLSLGPRAPAEAAKLTPVERTALLTRCEKRLIVAGFLTAHNNPDDDIERFAPTSSRATRYRRKKRQRPDPGPVFTRIPKTFRFCRLMAVYHYLVRRKGVYGKVLGEQFKSLCELGLFAQIGEAGEKDGKFCCRAPLELVKDCAADLGICLGEYLIDYQR